MVRNRLLLKTNKQNADLERLRLTSLINSLGDGVIAIDEKGRVVVCNGEALNILDQNSSMNGVKLSAVMKLVDKENRPINVDEFISHTMVATTTRDCSIVYSDGSSINVYLSIAPVHSGYDQSQGLGHVVLLRDITREKSLEEERDEFISVVSHELRNPVAIVEGNISNAEYMAERGMSVDKMREALKHAHDQVMFLSGLIDDLSTLSRAERGKLNVEIEAVNAHDLVNELIENYSAAAKDKGLTLQAEIDPKLELLKSSKLYVREILQNFITNAIKYTEKGGVTVGVKPHENGVLFTVSDTGIGISKSDKQKVFDKFFRADDTRTHKEKGTGLGLYVTTKLAKIIHADISLDSQLNKGSTFSIIIPNLE